MGMLKIHNIYPCNPEKSVLLLICISAREAAKKFFFSGPTTKAPLDLSGHLFFSELFFMIKIKFFLLSGPAFIDLELGN